MGKGSKLQLSFLNSIQICRPKDISSLVKSPLPALTHFSTLNSSKTVIHEDIISYPSFEDLSTKSSNIKATPLPCIMHAAITSHHPSQPQNSKTRKQDQAKLYASRFSTDSSRPFAPLRMEKKKEKATAKEPYAYKFSLSIPSPDNNDQERSSHGFNDRLTTNYNEEESKKSMRQPSIRSRRFKRFGTKEWNDGSITELDKKVNQSFVVVKRSVDPCEDFKKSMLEMIVEKQMFEPKELEQLLMSFLSLNSRMHHKAILKAFTEMWQEVFSASSNLV